MIGSVSGSRRANAFAQVVAESQLEGSRLDGEEAADVATALSEAPARPPEQEALLSVVHRLTALPGPTLGAETRSAQRALLVAAAESASCPAAPDRVPEQRRRKPGARGTHRATPVRLLAGLRPRSRLSRGLAASGLTMGVAAGALGGVAAASTDALPGDTLYGLKRGMEDLQLDFASGDTDRGRVYLDHAGTRLNEARRLMERGRSGRLDDEQLDDVRRALTSMRDDAAEGHRLLSQAHQTDGSMGPIESLSAFADRHRDTWAQLRGQLPVELYDISSEVSGVFDAIDEEIAPLHTLLPLEPESTATADQPGPATESQPPAGRPETTPATSTARGTPDDPPPTASGAASPDPTERAEGLLEGTGLLGPDPDPSGTGQSLAPSQPSPSSGELPTPEVTIPPLVEDLLPSLGLDMRESQDDGTP